MFRKMPFLLAAIILAALLLDPFIPLECKQFLYSISLTIKSLIIFVLPLLIFSLLFKTSAMLANKASYVVVLIYGLLITSNFITTFLARYIGVWVYHFDLSLTMPESSIALEALWNLQIPKIINNDIAMCLGLALGFVLAKLLPSLTNQIVPKIDFLVEQTLKVILYAIPLFIVGFIIKMQFDGIMSIIVKNYSFIFVIITLTQVSYILLAYFLLAKGRLRIFVQFVKNMLPATVVGFSSMSSAAAMPFSIVGVKKNAKHSDIASSVVPATVNVHLVGDCIAIPILAYAILKSYNIAEPSLLQYLIFTIYFVLAKFSVAAVPGGGILVMLPILENHLGFNGSMLSLITTLYILFDPVITSANVFGNGAFAKLIDRCTTFFNCTRHTKHTTT